MTRVILDAAGLFCLQQTWALLLTAACMAFVSLAVPALLPLALLLALAWAWGVGHWLFRGPLPTPIARATGRDRR